MFAILRKIIKTSAAAALVLTIPAASFAQTSLRTALDFDGDNKADQAIFRPSNNVWYINRSTAGVTSAQFGLSASDTPCPGDYDGDGKGDLCMWRDTDGVFYYIRSSTNTFTAQQWGSTNDEPVARVWVKNTPTDNRTDFAVVRRTGGQMIWYILDSATGASTAGQYGNATDYPIPGDYDGDGKFDLAVQRPLPRDPAAPTTPTSSVVFIRRSSDLSNRISAFGYDSDNFAPGDYDGDGKTDLAAVRDQNGSYVWYIENSSTGNLTGGAWGTPSTDFLSQADYDGDGKTDIAIWRDTNGYFYILGSQAGIQTIQFGSPSDFPVAGYDTH